MFNTNTEIKKIFQRRNSNPRAMYTKPHWDDRFQTTLSEMGFLPSFSKIICKFLMYIFDDTV